MAGGKQGRPRPRPAPPHSHPPVARPPPANQSTSKAASPSRCRFQRCRRCWQHCSDCRPDCRAAAGFAAVHSSQPTLWGPGQPGLTTQCRAGYAADTLIGSRPPGYIINPHFHPVKLAGLFCSGATSNGFQPRSENESCEIRAAAALDSFPFPQLDRLKEIKIPWLSGFADKQTKTSVKG